MGFKDAAQTSNITNDGNNVLKLNTTFSFEESSTQEAVYTDDEICQDAVALTCEPLGKISSFTQQKLNFS